MNTEEKKTVIDLSSMSRTELEDAYAQLYIRYLSAEARAERFLEEFKISQAKHFDRSSERNIIGQYSIYDYIDKPKADEIPLTKDEAELKDLVDEAVGKVKKEGAGKGPIPRKDLSGLEVKEVDFKFSEDEMTCPDCGSKLTYFNTVTRVEIEVEQPTVYVKKYNTSYYVCHQCEANDRPSIKIAPGAPKPVFYNSPVSASVVANCIYKKYGLALPFDRLAKDYERQGIPITKDNMCKWSIWAAERFFKPIVDAMHEILMGEAAIHCDETYTKVIHLNKTKAYVWVTTTAEYQKKHPIMIYNYRPGRSDADAREVLKGYHGYVMCDGYGCYTSVLKVNKKTKAAAMDIKPVACMVHIKREFVDALKAVKKEQWSETGAYLAVAKLQKIFHMDNEIQYSTYEERKEQRMGDLYMAMTDFFDYMREEQKLSLPSSKYGRAITYALNQEEKAMRLFEDGRLELDNNLAERTVKPYVIGRKNSLFNDTERGARASCILYSIVETAKHNHLDVYKYIKYVVDECRGMHKDVQLDAQKVQKLLPWSDSIPDEIKAPTKG